MAATLVDALLAVAADQQHAFVFVSPDKSERACTFAEVFRRACARAEALRKSGLVKGDRVALIVADLEQFVLSFFGAVLAGLVPVPISPPPSFKNSAAHEETIAHILTASGAALLITDQSAERPLPVLEVEAFSDTTLAAPTSVSPNDLCFLQFTSGSTAHPKGVAVTHGNLAANCTAFMRALGVDTNADKAMSWLPLYHDMGLIGFVIGPIFSKISTVLLPTTSFVRNPLRWLELIDSHRASISYAPSFAYALVAKRLAQRQAPALDLSCWRVAGCGAEPISAKALRAFAERLAPVKFDPRAFVASYGMAEATLAVTLVRPGVGLKSDTNSEESVCCGAALDGLRVKIVDANGSALPEREVGEILVNGASVAHGYYNAPELTAKSFETIAGEAWLRTGDLGYSLAGEVYVCGRLKDLIIVHGRNFYPSDIEAALAAIAGVRAAVAFSVGTSEGEGAVVCIEAPAADRTTLPAAAKALVFEQLGLELERVVLVPAHALPRTTSGKLRRQKTRQMFLDSAWEVEEHSTGGDKSR